MKNKVEYVEKRYFFQYNKDVSAYDYVIVVHLDQFSSDHYWDLWATEHMMKTRKLTVHKVKNRQAGRKMAGAYYGKGALDKANAAIERLRGKDKK